MNSTKRIVVNTFAQYVRSIINMLLSLISMRYIIEALGVEDWGIYSVVGGVVAMIGFINNSLSITTQRYISYYSSDIKRAESIFKNSLVIHIVFALLLLILMFILTDVVICHWLVIDSSRIYAAKVTFIIVSVILGVGIMTSPFRAMLISHENIVYMSFIDVCDGVLKLGFAIALSCVPFDKLIAYGMIMLMMQIFNLIAFSVYSITKYPECSVKIQRSDIKLDDMKMLTNFIGWTTYSMGVIVGRNQGIAIILNNFVGVVANAAYGIANQLYMYVAFVATSVLNAMNPQIMKAEGDNDRKKMLRLATLESKFSTALLMICCIPVIYEMPAILSLWLKNSVPDGAVMFCRMILIAFICDQTTYGLNTANQATGIIKKYILLIYTPKLILIGMIFACLYSGGTSYMVMILYLIVEIISALLRIPYIHITCGLNTWQYIKDVYLSLTPLLLVECIVCWIVTNYMDFPCRFVVTTGMTVILSIIVCWFVVLSSSERVFFIEAINKRRK